MHARAMFLLIALLPVLAAAAGPDDQSGNDVEQRDRARESLREKMAEAEKLHSEIGLLRQLAGEPSPNVRVRVRTVEVSLSKAKNLGWEWASTLDSHGVKLDEQLALLVQKNVARVRADENLLVADGFEARCHDGEELTPAVPNRGESDEGGLGFRGTEIIVTPKLQPDGRLAIKLVWRKVRPILHSDQAPQRMVHEISTAVEVDNGQAAILDGGKDDRVETTVTGVFPRAFGRMTDTLNQIQTFIIVSRELRPADRH